MKYDPVMGAKLVALRRAGIPLRLAAAALGVHVSTLCRWRNADPVLRYRLDQAEQLFHMCRLAAAPVRPPLRWRRDCPVCRAKMVVRTGGGARYWRCGRWPLCPWRSWRPRHPRNCRACGAARFWSHSRRSVGCGGCGMRTYPPLPA